MKGSEESAFRAKQIFDWIYEKKVFNFEGMKSISKTLISKLSEDFYINIPEIIDYLSSSGDDTRRILLGLDDGSIVECIIMRYKYGNSICVSTQIGYRMECRFCASTLEGMVRSLATGEILSETLVGQKPLGERISNIVLMGSGEPLDSYDSVMKFLELVNADYGLNIGQRHITLSTCGLVPKVRDMIDRGIQVTLAISLHAVSDKKRKTIIPIADKYSTSEILNACNCYIEKTGKRITFEHSLVSGVDDTKEDTRSLGRLLESMLRHVNLIPVSEIKEDEFKKSTKKDIEASLNTSKTYGVEAAVRGEMGSNINVACGQLRRSYIKSKGLKL